MIQMRIAINRTRKMNRIPIVPQLLTFSALFMILNFMRDTPQLCCGISFQSLLWGFIPVIRD